MALDLGELLRTTRRAAIVRGGLAATAVAALAGMGIGPAEAKKKKKKKKKKSPPPQVVAQLVATNMTGAKEFPGPGDDEAFDCSATFVIKSNGEICCNFTFNTKTPDSEITLTHIHQGVSGASGPPVVNFNGEMETCVKPGQAILDQIIAGPAGFYANLHTNKFPDGAVRDQLIAVV